MRTLAFLCNYAESLFQKYLDACSTRSESLIPDTLFFPPEDGSQHIFSKNLLIKAEKHQMRWLLRSLYR